MCPECQMHEPLHKVGCSRFEAQFDLGRHGRERTDEILRQAAETFRERNAVYKDNTKRVGEVLSALFPEGVHLQTPKDQEHYHLLVLLVVKITRHAVAWPKGHQDSVRDLAVYAAMIEALTQ